MLLSFSSSKAKLTSVFFVSLSFRLLPSFYWSFVSRSASYHDEKRKEKKAANFYGLSFLKQPRSPSPIRKCFPDPTPTFLFVLCKRRVSFASRFFLLFQLPRMRFAGFSFFAKYNLWIDLFEKCCFLHYCSQFKQYSKTKVPLANPYFWHFFVVPPPHYRAAGRKSGGTNFKLFPLEARSEKCVFPLHPIPISWKGLLKTKRDRKNCGLKDHANRRPMLRNPQKKKKTFEVITTKILHVSILSLVRIACFPKSHPHTASPGN